MPNSIIDISNVINVTLLASPSGLAEANINSLALFTNETPSNVDQFRTYVSPSNVGTDYGTGSETKAMADSIFAQSPNILSGGGRLVVIPMQSAVKGTSAKFETPDISANLSNFQAVSDGEFNIDIDGNAIDILALNFTNATTLQDVVDIIQAKLQDVIVSLDTNKIVFTSKKVGVPSAIVLTAVSGGSGTDLVATSLLNVAGGTSAVAVNSSGETLVEAIARVENLVQFVGIITNLEIEDAVVLTTSSSIQASNKYMWLHHFLSTGDLKLTTGITSQIKDSSNNNTRCLLYTVSLTKANLMKSAYAGRGFSVNFNGSRTTQTMNLKELKTILPDTGINQTILDASEVAGVDLYVNYGVPSVVSNGANQYFNYVYDNAWFKNALEVAGFNYLRQTNTKQPQDEEGMIGLKDAYERVCKRAINNKMLTAGLTWNLPQTFGNPEDLKRNITDVGYYIYSLPIAQQDQAERDLKKAPLIQIAIKLAGAIHSSDVLVNINK